MDATFSLNHSGEVLEWYLERSDDRCPSQFFQFTNHKPLTIRCHIISAVAIVQLVKREIKIKIL